MYTADALNVLDALEWAQLGAVQISVALPHTYSPGGQWRQGASNAWHIFVSNVAGAYRAHDYLSAAFVPA